MKDCSVFDDPKCPKKVTLNETVGKSTLNLLFVGCWGVYCKEGPVLMKKLKKGVVKTVEEYFGQRSVAHGMTEYSNKFDVDALILAGDNIYARSINDNDNVETITKADLFDMNLQFTLGFEKCMSSINVSTVLMAVGNHDITTCDVLNKQLNYDKWTFPGVYYNYIYELGEPSTQSKKVRVNLVFIDTNIYDGIDCSGHPYPKNSRDIQKDWVNKVITDNKCEWNLLIGHNPVISNGHKKPYAPVVDLNMKSDLQYIKESAMKVDVNVQAYLCADEHNQQFLTCESDVLPALIIAGSGGTPLDDIYVNQLEECTEYSKSTHGFVTLDINASTMVVTFYSSKDIQTTKEYTKEIQV
jgi:hypothetical protein